MRSHQKGQFDPRSQAFLIQKARRELTHVINEEVYIFLNTLYGIHIEEGRKTIRDYGNMTMFDIRSEIKLRVQMLRSYNNAKVRKHFEDEKKKQDELLAKLKIGS